MASASYHHGSEPAGRRIVAILLTVLVQLAILILLFRLATATPRAPVRPAKPITLTLLPEPKPEVTRTRSATRVKATGGGAAPRAAAPIAPPAAPKAEAEPVAPALPLALIPLSRAEFAAADIGSIPSQPRAAPGGGTSAGTGAGTGSDSTAGPGTGPGGELLYNAAWQREPTTAELAFYLPARVPRPGWAMIACHTIAGFRVDRCIELGQSPAGSGLSSAIRQAAWQFRVRPPRVGGRSEVGAWVRIRIDFTESGGK